MHSLDWMHLVEHIRGIIFSLDFLEPTQVGTINVGDSRVASYQCQYCIIDKSVGDLTFSIIDVLRHICIGGFELLFPSGLHLTRPGSILGILAGIRPA